MERSDNEVRVELGSPEAIRLARVVINAANGNPQTWPDNRVPAEDIGHHTLGPASSISFLKAIDRVAWGKVKTDKPTQGWALYMQNHYGRYTDPDLNGGA